MLLYGDYMTDEQRAAVAEDPSYWRTLFKNSEETGIDIETLIEMDQI